MTAYTIVRDLKLGCQTHHRQSCVGGSEEDSNRVVILVKCVVGKGWMGVRTGSRVSGGVSPD
jgi:hypothetical protein